MSLLAPLYFIGALAVAGPIIFHLIRRQPKGQVEFSSLMFLRPTPPRLTRRSRLDNWPLLLIRALALTLLALAFARPFIRSVSLSDAELPGRRIMLVIDTSASMQREGLWQQALDHASDVIDDLQPADQLGIVQFDRKPVALLSFDRSEELTFDQRVSTARNLIRGLAPTWHCTETGRALSFAGDLAVSYENDESAELPVGERDDPTSALVRSTASGPAQLILISDLQSGSELESMQVYAWPKELRLDVRRVTPKQRSNAVATILQPAADTPLAEDRVRVRVTNSADASKTRFQVRWTGDAEDGSANAEALPVQVPPGESRIVGMPLPQPGVTELVLSGDDHSFDNRHYVVSPEAEELELWVIGSSPQDPRDSLLYYLQRVPLNNPYRNVVVRLIGGDELSQVPDPKSVPLVILNQPLNPESADSLKPFLDEGGRLLVVLTGDEPQVSAIAQAVNELTASSLSVRPAIVDDYVMFSRIDFGHPLFAPMSDPKFNDFTNIRFWNHQTIESLDADWNVIVQFDDGDPALMERVMGGGRVFVLATGWQPTESQLAMSTKFIPIVFSLFESAGGAAASDRYVLGEPIDFEPSEDATITTPAATEFAYRSAADADAIDQPGVYQFNLEQSSRRFAVNLGDAESETAPLNEDELERFGVVLGKNLTTEQALENQRQLRDRELESEQKLWQWLLVAALGLLGLETLLGMLWTRRAMGPAVEGGVA